jgi:hypothetical protein
MATDWTVTGSFDAQVGQRIFTKDASSVHVCRQETTVTFQLLLRSQAAHVGRLHDMVKVLSQIPKRNEIKLVALDEYFTVEYVTHKMLVLTLTLFSHSNSVHMLRN